MRHLHYASNNIKKDAKTLTARGNTGHWLQRGFSFLYRLTAACQVSNLQSSIMYRQLCVALHHSMRICHPFVASDGSITHTAQRRKRIE
jgi:hypothetical protein